MSKDNRKNVFNLDIFGIEIDIDFNGFMQGVIKDIEKEELNKELEERKEVVDKDQE